MQCVPNKYIYIYIIYIRFKIIQRDIMIYDVIYDVYNVDMISTYIHINVLPVSGSHPMAQRIYAAVPPAPPGGGPAAKF